MIAAWMAYCVVCAAGLSVAALVAERLLLSGRAPVRLVWTGAVALSLVVPAAAYRFAPRSVASTPAPGAQLESAPNVSVDSLASLTAVQHSAAQSASSPSNTHAAWSWRSALGALARADRSLGVAWLVLSVIVGLYFVTGVVTLAWMRSRWRSDVVLGVPVFVSERTGPAVVGAASAAIVVPEWALGLEPSQLSLMLRHEMEHRWARDGQLMTAAQLAVVAMPWNIALWWQLIRLRVAIELDCDARVLRDVDARSYGDLLLEVARPRRGPHLMGAMAFAERATQLERRIRVIARHRSRTRRGARALAAVVGVVALSAAWVAPRPPVPRRLPTIAPIRSADRGSASVAPSMLARSTAPLRNPGERPLENARRLSASVAKLSLPPLAVARSMPDSVSGPSAPRIARLVAPVQRESPTLDSIFHRLFDGIALTADQTVNVRDFLQRLLMEQAARDLTAVDLLASAIPRRNAVIATRDSTLLSLALSDADRVVLASRLAPPTGGRGGRGGALPVDSLGGGGRVGGARGGGVGRGGRGGPPDPAVVVGGRGGGGGRGAAPPVSAMLAEAQYQRLFEGIALTPAQQATARAALLKAQDEIQVTMPRPTPPRLALRAGGLVVMEASSLAALSDLLTNDADRATLRSRVFIGVVLPSPPGR